MLAMERDEAAARRTGGAADRGNRARAIDRDSAVTATRVRTPRSRRPLPLARFRLYAMQAAIRHRPYTIAPVAELTQETEQRRAHRARRSRRVRCARRSRHARCPCLASGGGGTVYQK